MRAYLSIAEAAEILAVSPKTIRRRIDGGGLPAFRDGRLIRIKRADLDEYVARMSITPANADAVVAGTAPMRMRRRARYLPVNG